MIGDEDGLAPLLSGGIKLDIEYSPAILYQLAKMDGAITLSQNATKIIWANVQLTPDPTILSRETGTRHRTAERVSKQTDALVISISERREVVSLFADGAKYILQEIPAVLAKANQALADARQVPRPLRPGLDAADRARVRGRRDAARRAHRAPARRDGHAHGGRDRALHRRAGAEGRLIEMQLEEMLVGVAADRSALVSDYLVDHSRGDLHGGHGVAAPAAATRTCSTSGGWAS